MSYTQPFYGRLSNVTPSNNNIIITTGDFIEGSNQFTIVDPQLVRVNQTLTYVNSQFTGTVTITEINGNIITVDQNANSNASSGQTIGLNTPEGSYLIPSASFFDPQGFLSVNDITGSADADYDGSTPIYAFIGQATILGEIGTPIPGKFHEYKISEVIYRNIGNTELSMFIEWNEGGVESDSGDTLYSSPNQTLPIVELTPSSSLSTIFSNEITGLSGLTQGSELAGYQIALKPFLDTRISSSTDSDGDWYDGGTYLTSSKDVFITGSLKITGSAEFTTGIGGTDFFIIKSGSQENLKFNGEGTAQFFAHANNYTPTPILGGLYFTSQSVFVGLE